MPGSYANDNRFLVIWICVIQKLYEQGRIHGNPVADGWAGAIMRKPLGFQQNVLQTYRPTNLPTNQHSKMQV